MKFRRGFWADRSGNIALYAMAAMLPVLAAAGLAVDYLSLTTTKNSLQSSVDTAVLAVAAQGAAIDAARADDMARQLLEANFAGTISALAIERDKTRTTLTAETQMPMMFGALLGAETRDVRARATAEMGAADYEIGLILDTTGSMQGTKLATMKAAAKAMIDTMSASVKGTGKLRFALVPFSTFVNVGPQFGPQFDATGATKNLPAAWLDLFGQSPLPQTDLAKNVSRFAVYQTLGAAWPGCVETRPVDGANDYGVLDTAPSLLKPATLFVPSFNPDEPDDPSLYPNSYLGDGSAPLGGGTLAQRLERYGAPVVKALPTTIIGWIQYILAWKKVTPDTTPSTFYADYTAPKGPTFGCDTQPITALTADTAKVKANIDNLVAKGSTNILEGVMWGWRVLSSRQPFAEGVKEGTAGTRKIMVVLTDGTNTFGNLPNQFGSGYTSFGYLSDGRIGAKTLDADGTTAAMDTRTLTGCGNAKADGVEIFTILLEEDNEGTASLLQQCASDADHFIAVPDHDTLEEVFTGIVKKLGRVRLSG